MMGDKEWNTLKCVPFFVYFRYLPGPVKASEEERELEEEEMDTVVVDKDNNAEYTRDMDKQMDKNKHGDMYGR